MSTYPFVNIRDDNNVYPLGSTSYRWHRNIYVISERDNHQEIA